MASDDSASAMVGNVRCWKVNTSPVPLPSVQRLGEAGRGALGSALPTRPIEFRLGTYYPGLVRYTEPSDAECAIAQALGVVGEWWTLLIVREVAGGRYRFDDLHTELGLSRKILAERLRTLVENQVLVKQLYCSRPPRYEYRLTPMGQGLLPVLVALQDWGSRFVLGDGSLTATARPRSAEARRVHRLVGSKFPPVTLRDLAGPRCDLVADSEWTVLYCYPGAYATDAGYPSRWEEIPGAQGCTLESVTYRDRIGEFVRRGAQVFGVSTQQPRDQAAFAARQKIPFPLLSDQGLQLAAALRLPTFRAAGADWLKRITLLVRGDREIRGVLYPLPDPAGSVEDVLVLLDRERAAAARSKA
jgi:DNA-binding HxlR family transcriptional regulator